MDDEIGGTPYFRKAPFLVVPFYIKKTDFCIHYPRGTHFWPIAVCLHQNCYVEWEHGDSTSRSSRYHLFRQTHVMEESWYPIKDNSIWRIYGNSEKSLTMLRNAYSSFFSYFMGNGESPGIVCERWQWLLEMDVPVPGWSIHEVTIRFLTP